MELKDEPIDRKLFLSQEIPEQYFEGQENQAIERLLAALRKIEQFFADFNLNKKGKSKKKCPKKIEMKKELIQKSLGEEEDEDSDCFEKKGEQENFNSTTFAWSIMD